MLSTGFQIDILARNETGVRFGLTANEKALTFDQVIDLWAQSKEFIDFYVAFVKDLSFEGFFWEHPPLTLETLDRTYEVMLLRTRGFSKKTADPSTFENQLLSEQSILCFSNLGRNAKLVVPNALTNKETYKHFGSFLNDGPKDQICELFHKVSVELKTELQKGDQIWLNTAGLGVLWLHIRLDTRPKYYKVKAYKSPDFLKKK